MQNALKMLPQTMMSTEISDLTKKRHGDVIRDIRVAVDQLEDDANLRSGFKPSTYVAGNGKEVLKNITGEQK